DLVLARQFGLPRWLLHLVAATATATTGTRLAEPDDVLIRLLGEERGRRHPMWCVTDEQHDREDYKDMRDERGQRGGSDALRWLLEHEGDINRMLPFDVNRQMSGGRVFANSGRMGKLGHLVE